MTSILIKSILLFAVFTLIIRPAENRFFMKPSAAKSDVVNNNTKDLMGLLNGTSTSKPPERATHTIQLAKCLLYKWCDNN